jgi:hypothetical protein
MIHTQERQCQAGDADGAIGRPSSCRANQNGLVFLLSVDNFWESSWIEWQLS